jgi:hypothetical protein
MRINSTWAALVILALPLFFAGDLLMIGTMVTAMGVYFESPSTIFFGIYDLTLGFIFVRNTTKKRLTPI